MNNYSGINDISSLYNNQQQYNVPQDAIRNIPQNVTADQSQNYGIPTTQPGSSLPQGNKEEDSKSNEYYNSECFHMPIDFNLGYEFPAILMIREDVNDNCLFINNFKQQIEYSAVLTFYWIVTTVFSRCLGIMEKSKYMSLKTKKQSMVVIVGLLIL